MGKLLGYLGHTRTPIFPGRVMDVTKGLSPSHTDGNLKPADAPQAIVEFNRIIRCRRTPVVVAFGNAATKNKIRLSCQTIPFS